MEKSVAKAPPSVGDSGAYLNELSECELDDGVLVRVGGGAGITSSCS